MGSNSQLRLSYLTCYLVLSLLILSSGEALAQTTFAEDILNTYNLNIGGGKDGGHAWSDFDNDGDLDVLVLENSGAKSFLMQNSGGVFTNMQTTLASGMLSDAAERQAAWGDLNNDGRPDFMIVSHGNNNSVVAIQIFLQNAIGNTFGDGIGGTAPITVGENASATVTVNQMNVEGAGFFDFEGDGDLDIFFDSHNYGIELLRNNYINHVTHTVVNPPASGLYTHITTGNGPGVVNFGLNQFATDGDYGTAADVDDDGWVDIFMRKRDENDFFLNQGGVFTSGADLAQASNSNKGGNGLWDLDNDGDLDAVWTENGFTQIFRNDGPGIWTPLGAGTFPLLPQPPNANNSTSGDRIDALAGGDIDNDGDIDILFVGTSRSYLFINQLNSPTPAPGVIGSGAAMTFTLDLQTFNTRDGEGTTMVDIDDDGDLDIYMNINHSTGNQLWINNLPAANRNNHLIVDVTEDRAPDGSTGGFSGRVATGTNVLIKDCDGNIVSGLRQVNGVFGHGTQQPEAVHFGLPLGENQTYLIEVHYPNFYDPVNGTSRLIATGIAQPSTIPGTNHYILTTTDAETLQNDNAPIANDDLEVVPFGTTVSVQISLFDNDSEPDGENFFIESVVQPAVGSVVIDDADLGLVTYTYSAGTPFPGTTFDYTISDAQIALCPNLGKKDTATVTIYEPCADPAGPDTDGDGINDICDQDDDNDGIPDTDEIGIIINNNQPACGGETTLDFSAAAALESGTALLQGAVYRIANVTTGTDALITIAQTFNATVVNIDRNVTSPESFKPQTGFNFVNAGDRGYIEYNIQFVSSGGSTPIVIDKLFLNFNDIDGNTNYAEENWADNPATYTIDNPTELTMSANSTWVLATGSTIDHSGSTNSDPEVNMAVNYNSKSEITLRVGAMARTAGASSAARSHSIEFACVTNYLSPETYGIDIDSDGVANHLDLDSDNDGIYDAVEAGHNRPHTNGVVNGTYGANGLVDVVETVAESGTINYAIDNTDGTDPPDFLDTDSDDDGCSDANEAYNDANADGGDNDFYGTGNPPATDSYGRVTAATYPVPADIDTNSTYDHQEVGLATSITTQPPDTFVCPGCNTTIEVIASNADTYQWQLYNGSIWVDLTDSGIHSGTSTSILTITNATAPDNGNQYRVIVSNTMFVCISETSNTAILTLQVNTVITNRRITYRVNKN